MLEMYIQLDGQLSGTGLFHLDGMPIDIRTLSLTQQTREELAAWLERYRLSKYIGFKEYRRQLRKGAVIDLDKEGLRLRAIIQNELQKTNPEVFVTYWSEAVGAHLNDDGVAISDWKGMVGKMMILGLLFLLLFSCSDRVAHVGNTAEYRIIRIQKKESYYLIYASRNDSTFKIISPIKDNSKVRSNNKLKVFRSYNFDLIPVFPADTLLGIAVAPNLGIKGLQISPTEIVTIEAKAHNAIYTSDDLNGIYLHKIPEIFEDESYFTAINDFVHKEKRLLRDNDLFAVIASEGDPSKEIIIIGEDNKPCLQIEPKGNTVTFRIDEDNDTVFYYDTLTSQNVIVISEWSSEHPSIWADDSNVVINYSAFPTIVFEYEGKLFYWDNATKSLSEQTINTLQAFNQVDTIVLPVLPIRPDAVINDGKPYVRYVFSDNDPTRFKKYRVTPFSKIRSKK